MEKEFFIIENLKCGGCANSIKTGLKKLSGVATVEVNKDESSVTVEYTEGGVSRADMTEALLKMGYPEVGTVEGFSAIAANAKSFVSCAIGRMQ